MSEPDDGYLRDSEVALMDALKTVFEVLVAKRVVPAHVLGDILDRQAKTYPPAMPRAAFVLNSLRDFVLDPERAKARQQGEQFQQEPPAGTA